MTQVTASKAPGSGVAAEIEERLAEQPARRRLTGLEIAIETLWLAAVVSVPLAFRGRTVFFFFNEPKTYLLHLFALGIVALWAVEWAFARREVGEDEGRASASGVGSPPNVSRLAGMTLRRARASGVGSRLTHSGREWVRRDDIKWGLVLAGAYFAWVAASTALSPLPFISFIGRDPKDLGWETYSLISYGVVFLAIALRMRTGSQLARLLWALAVTGGVAGAYGIAQHLGWDPIGYGAGDTRVYSTFGNPIYFGSFLVMSLGATFALVVMRAGASGSSDESAVEEPQVGRQPGGSPLHTHLVGTRPSATRSAGAPGRGEDSSTASGPAASALLAALLGLQIAGLWYTGSRGPFLGAFVLIVVILGAGALRFTKRPLLHAAAAAAWCALIAATVALAPGGGGDRGSGIVGSTVAEIHAAGAPSEQAVRGSSYGSRLDFWRSSVQLATSWDQVPAESGVVRALRFATGTGPEMGYYFFPLQLPPMTGFEFLSHAHNHYLQVLVEQGWIGLALLLATLALAGVAVLRMVGWRGSRRADSVVLAGVVLLAVLAARTAEQMVGIARPSDFLAFWAMLGVVFAVASRPEVAGWTGKKARRPWVGAPENSETSKTSEASEVSETSAAPKKSGPERANRSEIADGLSNGRDGPGKTISVPLGRAVIAMAAVVGAVVLFRAIDVQEIRASLVAAAAQKDLANKRNQEAFDGFRVAAGDNGYVEIYALGVSKILRASAAESQDKAEIIRYHQLAREQLEKYSDRNPYAVDAQRELLNHLAALVQYGDDSLKPELARVSRAVAQRYPGYSLVQADASIGLLVAGESDEAMERAEAALRLPEMLGAHQAALYTEGRVFFAQEKFDEALSVLQEAVERDPDGPYAKAAHHALSQVYGQKGDLNNALQELMQAQ